MMSAFVRKMCAYHLLQAVLADIRGDQTKKTYHIERARTYSSPVGEVIAQTYN